MLEEWRDESSVNEHLNSNHFRELVPLFSEYLEKETEIRIYKKSCCNFPCSAFLSA